MRRVLKIALATAAFGLAGMATSAQAALALSSVGCSATTISPNYAACVGYYDNNLLNTANQGNQQLAIAALLATPAGVSSGLTTPSSINWSAIVAAGGALSSASLVGNTLNFGTTLSGWNVIGMHFGTVSTNSSTANDVSAFFLFDFTSPTSSITFDDRVVNDKTINSSKGFSNAAIYTLPGAVPEPATWGLMLLGFGGIGMALRRSRRRDAALMQVA